MSDGSGPRRIHESAELARLRTEIDELDRHIVGLLNQRAELVRAVGHEKLALGRRWIRDREREREQAGEASAQGPSRKGWSNAPIWRSASNGTMPAVFARFNERTGPSVGMLKHASS